MNELLAQGIWPVLVALLAGVVGWLLNSRVRGKREAPENPEPSAPGSGPSTTKTTHDTVPPPQEVESKAVIFDQDPTTWTPSPLDNDELGDRLDERTRARQRRLRSLREEGDR